METIDSIHSDFVADVCLVPDVELIRIRFEHPDISDTIFLKKSIKMHTDSRSTKTIKGFLNVINKYLYEVHYETVINPDVRIDVK